MHMKDDNMRNAQLKPGYNVQIAVDSEYIVAADISQDRNDVWTLVPFLKTMGMNLLFRYSSVTADAGYESKEGYTYLRENGQTPYIKPQTYEKWKNAASSTISAGGKICVMMKRPIPTLVMPGNFFPCFIAGNRKIKADMKQK